MRLLAFTLILAAFLADAAPAAWRPPVPGAVTRPFDLGSDPFEAGRHRGVDLAAAPGTTVRAACGGPVAFAGTAGSNGRVVTLLCGRRRVTHMPLASIAVRSGAMVRAGAPLGTLAASSEHRGLHLGVRRDGTRFGYEDPLRFLAPGRPATAPPLGPAPRPGRTPRSTPPPPAPRPDPVAAPRPDRVAAPRSDTVAAPRPHTIAAPTGQVGVAAPTGSNPGLRPPLAPWPAWLGLALVLAGAGFRLRVRSARAPLAAAGRRVGPRPVRG
jgi:hypothetical protein